MLIIARKNVCVKRAFFFFARGAPLCAPQVGACAPEASRQTWLLPPWGGRSAPHPGKILQGPGPLRPTICRRSARAWQSPARHPGDFPVAGKVTKGAPGGAPGPPEGGTLSPLRRCRIPPKGMRKGQLDGVEFVQLKSLRGCRSLYTPASNTARAQGRGIKGGYAPFAGGPGTRRFLAYLCLLSLREKVGRGGGAERPPPRGRGGRSPHKKAPRWPPPAIKSNTRYKKSPRRPEKLQKNFCRRLIE